MAGRIQVRIEANLENFKRGLEDGAKNVGTFRDKMLSAGKAAGIGIAAVGTAAIASVAALAAMTKSVANAGDELAKMSRKLGISTEDLSALGFAADLAGVPLQGLQTGLRQLSVQLFDASQGLAESQRNFQELGIEVKSADGSLRPIRDVLLDVSDRFASMTDATQRAALAQKIFGRAGLDMIPLLEGGSAAIREQMEEAKRLGIVWSTEAGLAAEAFNDNLTRLGRGLDGIKLAIGNRLIPILDDLIVRLVSFVQTDEFRNWVRDVADAIAVLLPRAIGFAIQTFRLLSIAANSAAIGLLAISRVILEVNLAVFQGGKAIRDLLGIQESLGVTTEQIAEKIAQLSASIEENRETMRFLIEDIKGSSQAFQDFSGLALPAIERVKPALKVVQEGVKKLREDFAELNPHLLEFARGLEGAEQALSGIQLDPVEGAMIRFRDRMKEISGEAQVFGRSFDAVGERISATTTAIKILIAEGVDPADMRIQQLRATLESLKALQIAPFWQQQFQAIKDSAATTWSSITTSFSSAVAGVIQGTATMAEFFKSILNTMIQAVVNLVIQMLTNWALATAFKQTQDTAMVATHTATESAKTAVTTAQETARLGIVLATNKVMLGATIATLAAIGAVGSAAMAVMAAVVAATAAVLTAIAAALTASIVGAPLAPAFVAAAAAVGLAGSAAVTTGIAAITTAIGTATAAASAALAAPLKHGGIVRGDTFARLGEAGTETVLPFDIRDMGGMFGGGEIHLSVMLDERTLLAALVPNIPGFVRIRAGIRTA